jgi:DNA-directed RNA polymerase subunit RPC12/RpoP
MITFHCPSCSRAIKAEDFLAGRSGKCQHCGAKITVPEDCSPLLHAPIPPARPAAPIAAPGNEPPPADYLIHCQDCDGRISPSALFCPHCGANFAAGFDVDDARAVVHLSRSRDGTLLMVLGLVGLLLSLLAQLPGLGASPLWPIFFALLILIGSIPRYAFLLPQRSPPPPKPAGPNRLGKFFQRLFG